MTILTKSFSEKKDKLVVPLVENEQPPTVTASPVDVEGQVFQAKRIIIFPSQARRVSSAILCLLIIALVGVSVGIIGGKILYNEYISVTKRILQASPQQSEGLIKIPLASSDDYDTLFEYQNKQALQKWDDQMDLNYTFNRNFFEENYEIDTENQYEKINVPDFRNGRSGRFIHDFNTNYTGIIDVTDHRCFVMPLNRTNVLPPRSLIDLVQKMWEGYYKVNTAVVRETMRVVGPPVSDFTEIGSYIASECSDMPIYKLEKYVGGVVKRAVTDPENNFGHFAGNGILEFDIINMNEAIAYEQEQKYNK
ncbi:uncharacterized protein LOC143193354 [Rhynchophorus ferrugineus]|uniref:Integral membrane protein 2 n=1 Tax=Rhynchophorus ferrugineus TaxID=354439 RepID=A0A834IGV1_RHYFE|nr:hypothetical protein GWI33_005738 [Rhynchophorus ferrugineus]